MVEILNLVNHLQLFNTLTSIAYSLFTLNKVCLLHIKKSQNLSPPLDRKKVKKIISRHPSLKVPSGQIGSA